MSKISLQNFTERTIAKGRIGFGDVRRLQRDILPEGISSREQADLLIALDRDIGRQDPAWIDWLVGALVDYSSGASARSAMSMPTRRSGSRRSSTAGVKRPATPA